MGNFTMVVKATADEPERRFRFGATEPAGFGPPMHIHHDAAEAFYVLEGEYIVFLEEPSSSARPGHSSTSPPAFATVPRRNVPSRKLNLYSPAAMVGYFDELKALLAAPEADVERLDEMASRYSMEVVGEVPKGYV